MNNHPDIANHAKQLFASFGKALPETAVAFSQLRKATFKDGALAVFLSRESSFLGDKPNGGPARR